MAESIQVPRDAHEAWNAGVRFALQMVNPAAMAGSQWATWERHNPYPASSGVGSPEQPAEKCWCNGAPTTSHRRGVPGCAHHPDGRLADPVPVQPQKEERSDD